MAFADGEVGKFIADEGSAKVPLKGKEVRVDESEVDFLLLGEQVEACWSATPPAFPVWASSRMAVIRAADRPDRDPGSERRAAGSNPLPRTPARSWWRDLIVIWMSYG